MKRIEIIFNQSIEEDIFGSLKDIPEAQFLPSYPRYMAKDFLHRRWAIQFGLKKISL